jgi:hypothetical protein
VLWPVLMLTAWLNRLDQTKHRFQGGRFTRISDRVSDTCSKVVAADYTHYSSKFAVEPRRKVNLDI